MKVCLFEDQHYSNLYPLTYMRPVWELVCGAGTIKEGFEKLLKTKIEAFITTRPHLSNAIIGADEEFLFINGRVLPEEGTEKIFATDDNLYVYDNQVVAFKGTKKDLDEVMKNPLGHPHREIIAVFVKCQWDLLTYHKTLIKKSVIEDGATVSQHACLDASKGAIVIKKGAVIHPFSILRGPLYIGENCRIAGEVSSSIIMANTNKAHYGFIGDSYICSWVNLGAGTTNSNLKNNYGTVKVNSIDTKKQFVGAFIGDHTTTAIGTMIYTGSVIGLGANIFGGEPVKNHVPSFSWGKDQVVELEKLKQTVQEMMKRRDIEFTEDYARLMEKAYEIAQKEEKDNKKN